MPDDWQNQSPDDYYRSQGLVLNSDGTEWVRPWVDSTPAPYQNPDASPADIAAYRMAKSVKRPSRLPVEQNAIPDAPSRPSYVMEPDLQEAQGGMQLPPGMMQDDSGRLYYADDPTTTIPMVRRPNVLPVANTPEGLKLVMPKMLDLASNVMGNVGGVMGGKVAAKAGEMVLGSGMVKKTEQLAADYRGQHTSAMKRVPAKEIFTSGDSMHEWGWHPTLLSDTSNRKAAEDFPTQAYHGTSTPGFEKFASPEAGQYMPDRALGIHVAKDPAISETFVKDKGAVYPVKIPADNKFLEVDQPLLPYIEDKATLKNPRNVHSDQNQIEKLIYKTVYKKDPEMLARYLTQARNVPEADALKLAKDMVAGKSVDLPVDGKTTFDKFIENFGGGKPYNEPDRAKAVEIFKKEMQDKGYVGIKYINTSPMETANAKDATSYIVFDPHKHIQSKYTKTLMSDTRNQVAGQVGHQVEHQVNQQGFYSALQTAVANAKVDKADAGQWLGYLKNQPGVKSEELNYTLGKLPEGQISRSQLEDIVKQNKVELGEKVLGNIAKYKDLEDAAQQLYKIPYEKLSNKAQARVQSELFNPSGTPTKYHSYQLPGGENYKEMLLKLPQSMVPNGRYVVTDGTPTFNMAANTKSEAQEILNNMQKHSNKPLSIVEDKMPDTYNNFQSSHWDEPNVLAHIRMNDRYLKQTGYSVENQVSKNARIFGSKEEAEAFANSLPESLKGKIKIKEIPNGLGKKTLHIEEIQSDLHQKGRDLGYKGEVEKLQPDFDKIEEKLMATNDEKMLGLPTVPEVLKAAVDKNIITPAEAKVYKRYTDIENHKHEAIPDLPFKNNWEELALKRVIRHAAENGYDAISWEHGNAQALRYPDAMRQQINGIEWGPRAKYMEKYHSDNLKEGVTHIVVDGKEGKPWFNVDKNGNVVSASANEAKGKHLSDVVGKDMSKQILEKREGNIDAKDFVMGAEGMKAAYDVRLPNKINEIGKKYGSKVEGKEIQAHKIMRAGPEDWRIINLQSNQALARTFKTKELAEAYSKEHGGSKPIHYFSITPALRDKATKEGFPLFSSGSTLIPVDHSPQFEDKKSKYKLTPVQGNPLQ